MRMNIRRLLPCLSFAAFYCQSIAQSPIPNPQSPLLYVDPFIGTGGHGHTYPGATAPFGLVQLSPDTRIDMMDWDGCSGYHYSDSLIYGFSHTHLSGTGVADYCDILFMPYTGGAEIEPAKYASPFKKSKEKAEAGYYSVFLEKDRIKAELTATEHVGVHRYTFPQNRVRGHLLVDLRHRDEVVDSYMKRVSDREIEGYRVSKAWAKEQHVYFVARFSKPVFNYKILDMNADPREANPSVRGKAIVGLLDFNEDGEPLVVTVGISGVSVEGARKNLETECNHFDFDKTKAETQAKWERELSKIEVDGGSDAQKTVFYTALYHTMVVPNIWNDVDGQYRGRDNNIHQAKGHDVYTVFSLWDTYRACNPLYTILEPKRTNDFVQTFLRQYEQGGLLPVWELSANETDCMIGNHAIPVIADAYAKGIRDYDAGEALEAMMKSAGSDRYGLKWYRKLGYIPSDKESESVSKTLEYAFDDQSIARMAGNLGKMEVFEEFSRRAQSYKNLFDPSTGFFRAKSNASWCKPFDPYEVNFNFTEANAWQYRFAVPHDLPGLEKLLGGVNAFADQLDSLFSAHAKTTGRNQADITGLIGQYVHGNEPSHHMAYLYNFVGQPWKTQQRIRQIMDEMYSDKPDGLSGNEDCGQMSAWLVFSAMGFYPVVPGEASYWLGTPWFEEITLHLDNGNTFSIHAPGVSTKNFYVKRVQYGDAEWPRYLITHEMLLGGGSLTFEMNTQPAGAYGNWVATPVKPSVVSIPFVAKGERIFRKTQTLELGCADKDATIYYTLDGDKDKSGKPEIYSHPIPLSGSGKVIFYSKRSDEYSKTDTFVFARTTSTLTIHHYNTRYNAQYTARGDNGLVDGLRGGADFRTGDWQGFEGVNLDVVLDLGKKRKINKLSAGFLQDENSWIFFPVTVQVEISDDGQHFTPAGALANNIPQTEKGVLRKDFTVDMKGQKARYVRVTGVSPGKCPEWHKGAGNPCWVFADEILVE